MDLQKHQRNLEPSKRKVYDKTLDPERTYLNRIYGTQKCDANPAHRNIYWDLELDEWISLVTQNCYICGSPPVLKEGKMHDKVGRKVPINGLDRIVNEKGYTMDNVRPCCSKCNYMKHKLPDEEFLKHIELIWRNNFANIYVS
jgi:hypothetical protein